MMKIRKIHCVEEAHGRLDKMSTNEAMELAGFYIPSEEGTWTVTMLFEGSFYEAKDQGEAKIIANGEMIKGILLSQITKLEKAHQI